MRPLTLSILTGLRQSTCRKLLGTGKRTSTVSLKFRPRSSSKQLTWMETARLNLRSSVSFGKSCAKLVILKPPSWRSLIGSRVVRPGLVSATCHRTSNPSPRCIIAPRKPREPREARKKKKNKMNNLKRVAFASLEKLYDEMFTKISHLIQQFNFQR